MRAVVLLALASCGVAPIRPVPPVSGFASHEMSLAYHTTYEIQVECSNPLEEGTFMVRGSGTAIASDKLLTARHLHTCDLPLLRMNSMLEVELVWVPGNWVWIQGKAWQSDSWIPLAVQDSGEGHVDAAVYVPMLGDSFRYWAPVSRVYPRLGDEVCVGAAVPGRSYRCGPVQRFRSGDEWPGDGSFDYWLHSTPGNSGGGVWLNGQLIGVNVGTWLPNRHPIDGIGYGWWSFEEIL